MLLRFEVKNFRSCADVRLDNLTPVTGLIGRNGAGKTNILAAIRWCSNVSTASAPVKPLLDIKPTECKCEFIASGNLYRYTASLFERVESWKGDIPKIRHGFIETLYKQELNRNWMPLIQRRNGAVRLGAKKAAIRIGPLTPSLPAIIAIRKSDKLNRELSIVVSALRQIRYYSFDSVEEGFPTQVNSVDYLQWLAQYETTGDAGESTEMRIIHFWLRQPHRLDELNRVLGPKGLGLVYRVGVGTAGGRPRRPSRLTPDDSFTVMFELNSGRPRSRPMFSFDGLSLGTQRLVRMVTAMLFDNSTTMLIEHPEDAVHPGLLRRLIATFKLYSNQMQFIVTSHSPDLVDELQPSELRLVWMDETGTHARELNPEELTAAGRFLSDEGSLSEFVQTTVGA